METPSSRFFSPRKLKSKIKSLLLFVHKLKSRVSSHSLHSLVEYDTFSTQIPLLVGDQPFCLVEYDTFSTQIPLLVGDQPF